MLIKKNLLKKLLEESSNSAAPELKKTHDDKAPKDNREFEKLNKTITDLQAQKNALQEEQRMLEEQLQQMQAQSLDQLEGLERQLVEQLKSLHNSQQLVITKSKPVIIDIAIDLATKLTQRQVTADPTILEAMMSESIDQLKVASDKNTKLTLLVSPNDREIATDYAAKLGARYNTDIKITSQADIADGSCILESSFGSIDLNFFTQLMVFREKLLNAS